MVSASIATGLELGAMPPPALNRALVYFARLSRLDSVWVLDHFQGKPAPARFDLFLFGQSIKCKGRGELNPKAVHRGKRPGELQRQLARPAP